MLQTRTGKRNGMAAIQIALDLFKNKTIDSVELIKRIQPNHIQEMMHPSFNPNSEKKSIVLTSGLPAGPGCAVGRAVFTSEDAENWAKKGQNIILIREETSPEDIHGMHVSNAIITSRGGMTSHAALVARGWGKCCVVGCLDTHINIKQKTLKNRDNQASDISKSVDIDARVNQAIACHRSGQLQQAEQICQQILDIDPQNAEVLNLFGLIACQAEKYEIAVDLISHAQK